MQYNLNFRYIFANKPMLQRVNLVTTNESDVYQIEEIFGFLNELPTLTILDIRIEHRFSLNHYVPCITIMKRFFGFLEPFF